MTELYRDPAGLLTVQFLAWLDDRPRRHDEVMAAWRSSCPRLTIWEDAVTDDLVRCGGDGVVSLTPRGRCVLALASSPRAAAPPS